MTFTVLSRWGLLGLLPFDKDTDTQGAAGVEIAKETLNLSVETHGLWSYQHMFTNHIARSDLQGSYTGT